MPLRNMTLEQLRIKECTNAHTKSGLQSQAWYQPYVAGDDVRFFDLLC